MQIGQGESLVHFFVSGFAKSPELKPAPAANTEEFFLTDILSKRQIFVRCKVRGFQAGKPFPCRSR